RLDQVAQLLDNRFRIPGTEFRFGFDSLLGLVPYVGDVITFGVSGLLILVMGRYGASSKLAFKMIANIWFDGIVGTIPIIGDFFDFGYRANLKNVQLLREHYESGAHSGNVWGILILMFVLLIAAIVLSIFVVWKVMGWLIGMI
ncbi:MAG TPA: DUF4112 domain-containing protein, partial [Saprospiraceae bacterium]|nr:DUF4112 domain-containing protein [Saprospiraceae bacterium]